MSQRKSGIALLLALAVSGGSIALMEQQANICSNRPALAVLAVASAFVLALSIRLLRLTRDAQALLIVAALLSLGTLFADARFVITHRGACGTDGSEQSSFRLGGEKSLFLHAQNPLSRIKYASHCTAIMRENTC